MTIAPFPFDTIDWSAVEVEEHIGETGMAYWQTRKLNDIRVRQVVYSPGYKANHWCKKGHVLLCIEGSMQTELEDGRMFTLDAGMSYFVGDNNEAHRSSTVNGCRLFIVD